MQSTNERETNDSEDPESESEDGGSKLAGRDGDEVNRPSPTMNGGLFKDEANRAINFFIHDSVKKAHVIQKLTEDITVRSPFFFAFLIHIMYSCSPI